MALKENFLNPVWNIVSQQPIPQNVNEDSWKWRGGSSGLFSFHPAWDVVRQRQDPYQLASMIWFPSSSPKMATCLLRALQNKLLTRVFLKNIGVSDTDVCVLCTSSQETIQHLFFECQFSAYLWSLSRIKLGLTGPILFLQEEAMLIQEKFKAKVKSTILTKITLAANVWHIWKERNLRVFQLQQSHKVMVFRRLYEDIRLLMRTCTWKVDREKELKAKLSNWSV